MKGFELRNQRQHELEQGIHVSSSYDLKELAGAPAAPRASIYLPIHRTEREGRRDDWDRVEFKDLVGRVQKDLARTWDEREVKPLLERLDLMVQREDLPLWLEASAGLAFLVDNDGAWVINLGFAPEPRAVVGDAWYLEPLVRNLRYRADYRMLLLNADFFALLDGDYNGVSYVPLPDDVKSYFAETYPEFDGETTALDYYSLEDHQSPYHDFKSRNDVKQEEAAKFFRYVDKAMNDVLVRDSKVPVILVTAPEHDHEFRKICSFASLLPQGIKKDPRTLSGRDLRDGAIAILEGIRSAQMAELRDRFAYGASKDTASDQVEAIALALTERKVEVLFLEEGKVLPGHFDQEMGTVTTGSAEDANVLNEFALAAVAQDAQLVVLPHDAMPTDAPVAAIFRF